jgi:hypothetical protein
MVTNNSIKSLLRIPNLVCFLDADHVGGLNIKYANDTQIGLAGANGWINLAPANGLNPSSNLDFTCRDTFNEWAANTQGATNNFASVNPPLYKTSGGVLNNKPFVRFNSASLNWLTQRVTTPQQVTVTNGLTWFGVFYAVSSGLTYAFAHGGAAPNIHLKIYRNNANTDPRVAFSTKQDWRIHNGAWIGSARNNRNNLNFFLVKRTLTGYEGYVGGLDSNSYNTISGFTAPTSLGAYSPYMYMGCNFLSLSPCYNGPASCEFYNLGLVQRPTTNEEDQLIINYLKNKFQV